MTARLDPIQLDRAWDALLLGERFPMPVDDIDERELLELLATPVQQAPRPAFVQALERELNRSIGPEAAVAPAAGAAISMPRFPNPASRRWQRPPSRWMTAGYALAAIALIVFLSSFAIAWQHRGNDNGPAIPAVSEWTDAGPPTSPGVETNTLFSHTFSVDELADYAFDRWGWVQFVQGTVEPHQYSTTPDGLQEAMTMSSPGISFIEVERGQLTAHLNRPALVGNRTAGGELAQVQAGADVTLGVGDTLVFGLDSLAQFWNPTSEEASYVAGGLYIRPDDPIVFPGSEPQDVHTGTSFDAEKLAGVSSLTIAMDQVTIGPGETYAYAITPQTLLLGNVTGEGLVMRGWSNSARDETARTLSVGMHTFHRNNPGYYTFTNNGTAAVDVYLMRVAPPATAQAEPDAPTSSVSTLFEKTLTPDEMTAYESEAWKWIGMSGGTMPPGSKAVIVEGSPVAGDIGFDGLGAVSVTSGTLVANAAEGATVERGATGAIEPVDRSENVTLEAGDTLIVPPKALPAIWNTSNADATYLAGGVYTQSNITPLNEMDFDFDRGGIRVDPNDLNVGAPISISFEQVLIPAGGSYSYSVSSETWLEAIVRGGNLRQERRIAGVAQGQPKTLIPSLYSLHSDGFGDYTLTNEGSEPVDVSFFRVEAQDTADAVAPSTAQVDTLVDQTLTLEQLQEFKADGWTWIDFERNTIEPQGDAASVASLGKIPGRNEPPGVNILSVETGTLMVAPESDVLVARGASGALTTSQAGTTLTLDAGDTIVYPTSTGGKFWNPTDVETTVIGGGGYRQPSAPTFALANTNEKPGGPGPGQFGAGIDIEPGDSLSSTPLDLTIERVTIGPNADLTISVDPTHWAIAVVEQGDLEQSTTTGGDAATAAVPVRQGEITLRNDEAQTVVLRNAGSDAAVVYIMRLEPKQPTTS